MIEEIFAFLAWLVTAPAALVDGLKLGDVPTMATPQMSLDNPAIVSALIGSGSAIAVILLRDGLFAWIKASWLRKRTDDEVYRRYLGPLAEACAKIVWRSKEIFLEHRHSFLNTAALPRDFNEYKRISTLYRIASLLGWIRGMEIELSSLAAHNPAYTAPIAAQINAFRKALADGPDVERDRLLRICGVWGLDTTPMEEMNIAHLAGRFEVKSHSAFGDEGKALSDAVTMDHDKKLRALRCLADFLATELNLPRLDDATLEETIEDAAASLFYREALIYREWQDAIADAMIERDPDSPRRFRIIGFTEFSKLIASREHPWMKVFAGSLDDIDFERPNPQDVRAHQLRKIANAAAAMVIEIDKKANPSPVTNVVGTARKIFAATQ
ncbi:hypothetical protein [Pseudophaeobacter sp.]|uniref:hypothetical protein n=1 Tax=Pseudophaeobacter sp. TaxID=1971739 RepID=UPI0025CD2150|nr:hypothetical protein [uncultured Pseudophaeobacter sp.]